MKKIFLCLILVCLFLTGCGKKDEKDVLDKFKKMVEGSESYYLSGTMELVNNEDVYSYKIGVSYQKDDYYKIELTNMINNHQQIILRNSEGVYVVTPSLNKSFKFQSDWPYNNSQVYLLGSLLDDIENDEARTFEKVNNEYVFTSTVNYPNNPKLIKQKIYFDEDYLPSKVMVLDDQDNEQIKMLFDKIDLKTKFNDTYFDLNSILNTETDSNNEQTDDNKKIENTENQQSSQNSNNETQEPGNNTENQQSNQNSVSETKETATIDDIIYPMYLPANTYLTSQERVSTEDGERLILTFSGDSSFVLVEETASYSERPEIIPTYGSVELIGSSLAVINDNSANWFLDGIEYYVVSDTISKNDLIEVVKSISVLPVSK